VSEVRRVISMEEWHAIKVLKRQGHGKKAVARQLGIAWNTVKAIGIARRRQPTRGGRRSLIPTRHPSKRWWPAPFLDTLDNYDTAHYLKLLHRALDEILLPLH
jgi:hypothetical protein